MEECFFCQTKNQVEQCDKCPIVHCGQHKVIHQPEKLEKCLPFVVSRIENVGRVLKAAQILKKGQIVMFDRAFTIGKNFTLEYELQTDTQSFSGPIMQPACLGCLQTLKADHTNCPTCTLPICNLNCDMLHQHLAQECNILAQAPLPPIQVDIEQPNSMYNCIGLMRMLLQMQRAKEGHDPFNVNLLMDHFEAR